VKLLAPAKINLGLRVLGRRADGNHELDSLFLPLEVADEVEVEIRPARQATVSIEVEGDAPEDDSNLAVRAAHAYLAKRELSLAVNIQLRKQTPAAAGLGGGSSDAAAVLRALQGDLPGGLPPAELASLALDLGADVPFFLDPRPSRVRGIGERVEPVSDFPSLSLLLVNPGVPVSTADVFRAYDLLGASTRAESAARPDAYPPDPLGAGLADRVRNDLEAPALHVCPELRRVRQALEGVSALAVGLSGSGGTFYGVFRDTADAHDALGALKLPTRSWSRVARTLESG